MKNGRKDILNEKRSETTGKSVRTIAREKSPAYQEFLKKMRKLKTEAKAK